MGLYRREGAQRVQEDLNLLKKRFSELAERAYARGRWYYSDFLSLGEQSALGTLRLGEQVHTDGGYEAAERRIACFGSLPLCGCAAEPPIACVCIRPVSARFAEPLTHRDYLGSLMGLGLEREVLGDILVHDGCAWLFCLRRIAPFVTEQLVQVRRTPVGASEGEPPALVLAPPEPVEVVAASERLDAVMAAVYRLSRAEAKALVESGLVFLDGLQAVSAAAELREGVLVSVRGHGRFRYEGPVRDTRRGRLRVCVRVY